MLKILQLGLNKISTSNSCIPGPCIPLLSHLIPLFFFFLLLFGLSKFADEFQAFALTITLSGMLFPLVLT